MSDVVVRIRARAFSGDGLKYHLVLVSGSDVRVWDPISGYFTNVNILDAAAKKRAILAAKRG